MSSRGWESLLVVVNGCGYSIECLLGPRLGGGGSSLGLVVRVLLECVDGCEGAS